MAEHETFAKIRRAAQAALQHAAILLPEWLPEGKRNGTEWVARNLVRGDRTLGSFGVSLTTGKWNDFADSEAHGGDLVSLLSYLRGCRQIDAAMEIDRQLGLGIFKHAPSNSTSSFSASAGTARVPEPSLIADKAARRWAETAEKQAAQQAAAEQARQRWQSAFPAKPDHAYLSAKAVAPYGLRQASNGALLVPLYHDGVLVNLQQIAANGQKRFLKGGRVQGGYAPLGRVTPGRQLFICEGWATGATVHRATGEAVACAMHAGNLTPVARHLRSRYGDSLDIVIAGDDDRHSPGNPGRTAANAAALAVGALVVFPAWPDDAPEDLSDFNDLYRWHRQQGRVQ